MFFPYPTYAEQKQVNQEGSAPLKKPSMIEQFMPFVFLLLLLYFLFIRPNQKRIKKHQEFTNTLKVGDSVLTSGGILGTVDGLTDQYVILEIANKIKIRILRSHISSSSADQQTSKTSATPSKSPINPVVKKP